MLDRVAIAYILLVQVKRGLVSLVNILNELEMDEEKHCVSDCFFSLVDIEDELSRMLRKEGRNV